MHCPADMQSPNGEVKPAIWPVTPASSGGPICRICHEGDAKEDLTAPCKCAGSMQLVHRTCLEKWLSSSNSNTCEICKFKFIIYRQPRPFTEWVRRRTDPEELRNMLGDILCFLLLTPLAAVSTYLCFTGAKHYSAWNTKWEASGLICLSVMLISIYVTWVFVTVRYHHRNWKDWRNTNQDVFLIQMHQLSSSRSPLGRLSLATPTSVVSFAVHTPTHGLAEVDRLGSVQHRDLATDWIVQIGFRIWNLSYMPFDLWINAALDICASIRVCVPEVSARQYRLQKTEVHLIPCDLRPLDMCFDSRVRSGIT